MKRTVVVLSVLSMFVLPGRAWAADADPYRALQWGLERIDAARAWAVADGSGVRVAVLDTGVDADHPDLRGRVRPGIDLVDDDDDADDENGHGTLIAGIIAARASNGVGGSGIAPGASIVPVRVLDDTGTGNSRDVAAGIRWAVENGVHVINLSLAQAAERGVIGNLLADPSVDAAITDASDAGVTVVIASGNDPTGGRDQTSYDATVPGAVVVGATTRRDRLAAYANHGDGLDLVAPGGGSARDPSEDVCGERNGIVSTWWNPSTRAASYGAGCGTSMAVAFVSGVAAMLHETGMTNVEAIERILATADPIGHAASFGAGRLDAGRALAPEADMASAPSRVTVSDDGVTKVRGERRVRLAPTPGPMTAPVERDHPSHGEDIVALAVPAEAPASEGRGAVPLAGLLLIAVVGGHLGRGRWLAGLPGRR